MRGSFFTLLLGLAAYTAAQSQLSTRGVLEDALGRLRNQGLALLLDASASQRRVNAYFVPATPTSPPKIEIFSYSRGALQHRWIGDGADLFRYNTRTRQYSASPYRTLGELLTLLNATSIGLVGEPIRLLTDIYRDRWNPWLPAGRTEEALGRFSVLQGDPIHTAYDFLFTDRQDGGQDLSRVEYYRRRGVDETTWHLDVRSGFEPVGLTFRFVPGPGDVPVSAPASVRISD